MPPREIDPSQHNLQPGITSDAVFPEATPDLRILLPAAESGDEAALTALHALNRVLIDRRLRKYSNTGVDPDEIHEAVAEKLLRVSFDPNWPLAEGTPPEAEADIILGRYGVYIAKTIRSIVADDTPRRMAEVPMTVESEAGIVKSADKTQYDNGSGVTAIPNELINEVLATDLQKTIFYLRLEGASYPEICEQLGMEESAVRGVMQRAIQRLEKRVLNPSGLFQIGQAIKGTNFNHRRVLRAIREGNMQAVKIFCLWYVKREWLDGLPQPKNIVLLGDIASQATARAVRRRYADRLIRHDGRVYIRAEDVELIAKINEEKRLSRRRATPPKLGYISLGDIECTEREYIALRNGTYSENIARRRRRFVPEAEALDRLAHIRAKAQDSPTSSTSGEE